MKIMLLVLFVTLYMVMVQDVFSDLINCHRNERKVHCQGESIEAIPDNLPANLHTLEIRNGFILKLETTQLIYCKWIEELYIEESNIMFVQSGAFDHVVSLQTLSLKGNIITTLERKLFSMLKMLKVLILNHNLLFSVDGIFQGLSALEELFLDNNRIVNLTNDAFQDLNNLHHLELGNNHLTYLNKNIFKNNRNMTILGLESNSIKNIDNGFTDNIMLQFINLTDCQLDAFPRNLPQSIVYLILNNNNISRIYKNDTKLYRKLTTLAIEHNYLTYIEPATLLQMSELSNVYMQNNKLIHFPGPFTGNIKTIALDNNQISTVPPGSFKIGTELRTLSLCGNNISSVSFASFENVTSINELHLDRNPISLLKDSLILPLNDLSTLTLNHITVQAIFSEFFNVLSSISLKKLEMSYITVDADKIYGNIFQNLPYLESLHLRKSPTIANHFLSDLNKLQPMQHLTELNLMDNELEMLNADMPKCLPRLKNLSLTGNSFVCNKDIIWLQDWYNSNSEKFHMFDQIKCHKPDQYHGYRIKDFNMNAVHTNPNSSMPDYSISNDEGETTSYTELESTTDFSDWDSEIPYYYDIIKNNDWKTTLTTYNIQSFLFIHTRPTPTNAKNMEDNDNSDIPTNASVYSATPFSTGYTGVSKIDDDETRVDRLDDKLINSNSMATQIMSTMHTHIMNSEQEHTRDQDEQASNNDQNYSKSSTSLRAVGISIGMAFGVIFIMLLLFMIPLWRRHTIKKQLENKHSANVQDYVITKTDTTEYMIQHKMSRNDRGSTTSMASEDITNQSDISIKVYTLNVDA